MMADDQDRLRSVLRDHWPTIICDHEAKTDRAQCSCCTYEPPVMPSVGAAVDSWIDHLLEVMGGPVDG
jgi:hypothetical protein